MTPRTPCRRLAQCLLAAALCAPSARAQTPPQPTAWLDCMIQPNQVVQVGSAVPGVVERITVERGDMVAEGQVVARLAAQVERAALAVARERASQTGETVVARSAQDLARNELARANELYAQDFVSKTFVDKQLAEAQGAEGRTEQASEKLRLARREVELAEAQLAQRTLRSPVAGVVVERMAAPGELVDQKPLLRIAAIDPLRVDVLVPAAAFGQVEPGRKGQVVPELLNRSTRMAVVKSVDRVVDAASNTFRVRLELPNPGGALPAGLRCKVDLALKLPEPAPAPRGAEPVARTPAAGATVATNALPRPR